MDGGKEGKWKEKVFFWGIRRGKEEKWNEKGKKERKGDWKRERGRGREKVRGTKRGWKGVYQKFLTYALVSAQIYLLPPHLSSISSCNFIIKKVVVFNLLILMK